MPKNGSIDIPHVAVTDHYIRRKPIVENKKELVKFISMICYNNNQPDNRTRARAFLEFYERYENNPLLIDSAFYYLKKSGVNIDTEPDVDLIRTYFLKENYNKIIQLVKEEKPDNIKDAWTCYRIGESYSKNNDIKKAINYFEKSIQLKRFNLDFQYKLANAYLGNNQIKEAKNTFKLIINENPKHALAYAGLGYIEMSQNNLQLANYYLQQSNALNPDQVQTLINISVIYYQSNQKEKIKPLLMKALKIEPTNKQVISMLQDIN
jgi:tetratricopeptide (TPR) repeat protein